MRTRLRCASSAAALALTLSAALPAAAQMRTAAAAAVETDSKRFSVLTAEISAHPAGEGFVPALGLVAYRLHAPGPEARAEFTAVSPAAGAHYQAGRLGGEATIGYLFLTEDGAGGFGAPRGAGEGVVTSARGDYTAPTRGVELAVSYNWVDRYIWTRGSAAQRLGVLATGTSIWLGGEGSAQRGFEVPPLGYKLVQGGASVELRTAQGWRLLALGGAKIDNIAIDARIFPYLKLEISFAR